jgi:hypothetical protein
MIPVGTPHFAFSKAARPPLSIVTERNLRSLDFLDRSAFCREDAVVAIG